MASFTPRRFPGKGRRFDSAASLVPVSVGLGYYRRGMGATAPSALAAAIAKAEGYGVPGAIPTVAHNPGDLAMGDIGYGVTGSANITKFPDDASGYQALQNQINKISSGTSTAGYTTDMSIAQVGNIYSGSSNGNWANNVATALGVSPDANFAAQASNPGTQALSGVPDATTSTDSSTFDFSSLLTTDNAPYLAAAAVGLGVLAWAVS